jgi:hypothetical protein
MILPAKPNRRILKQTIYKVWLKRYTSLARGKLRGLIFMPKLTQLEELDIALKLVAQDAEPGTASAQLAADFCQENRELIEPFLIEWAIEKVTALIAKYRRTKRHGATRPADPQLVFEEMLGFKHLPAKVPGPSGNSIPRLKATVGAFRRLVNQRRKIADPILQDALRAIDLMEPYVAESQRITWREVLKKEAVKAGLDPDNPKV